MIAEIPFYCIYFLLSHSIPQGLPMSWFLFSLIPIPSIKKEQVNRSPCLIKKWLKSKYYQISTVNNIYITEKSMKSQIIMKINFDRLHCYKRYASVIFRGYLCEKFVVYIWPRIMDFNNVFRWMQDYETKVYVSTQFRVNIAWIVFARFGSVPSPVCEVYDEMIWFYNFSC